MKQTDIKQLSTKDLRLKELKKKKRALAKMKMNHTVSPIENPAKNYLYTEKQLQDYKLNFVQEEIAEAKK